MASEAVVLEVPGPEGSRTIRISSPSRVLWPDVGITKLGLAQYLIAVAGPFLEANGDRPVSLQRFSDGVDGESFFSKNPPKGVPDFVRTAECTYPSGRRHPQLVIDEIASAVWMAQMNTIVFHAWPTTASDTDNPDQVRLDLDPQPGLTFTDVVEVAREVRAVLSEAGLTAYVKTSGNRGLHIFAPVTPAHEFLDVRHGVIAAAREVTRRMPALATTSWWKEERGERVFLDYNQAARDRTMAGAYSPRPLPQASVSCPVEWDELDGLDAASLTVLSVPERLADVGDPWAGMRDSPGNIDVLLDWWQRDLDDGLGELVFPPDYPKMPGEPPRVQPSKAKKPG